MMRHAQPHIVLPRLDAREASALGQSLVSALEREGTPDFLLGPASNLRSALANLDACAQRKLGAPPRPNVRAAQLAEGTAWNALHWLVVAWSKLPREAGPEQVDAARAIERAVFAEGLPFLHMPSSDRWVEAHLRLTYIERALVPAIERIGGAPFLDHLRRTHAGVGAALGITERRPAAARGPSTKACLTAFLDAVRCYVLVVAALRGRDEASRARAERLLAPIEGWKAKPHRRRERAPQAEAPALPQGLDMEGGDLEAVSDPGSAAPAEAPALPQAEIIRAPEARALPSVEIEAVEEATALAAAQSLAAEKRPRFVVGRVSDARRQRATTRHGAPSHSARPVTSRPPSGSPHASATSESASSFAASGRPSRSNRPLIASDQRSI
jgi:hypothetical protein